VNPVEKVANAFACHSDGSYFGRIYTTNPKFELMTFIPDDSKSSVHKVIELLTCNVSQLLPAAAKPVSASWPIKQLFRRLKQ
jgi:hypothetical protein